MSVEESIRKLAAKFSAGLDKAVAARVAEMKKDDTAHYLLYGALGVSNEEGELIDVYQNKGRFLYKYAGSFLEEAAKLCIMERFPAAKLARLPNTVTQTPKTFEIDMLVDETAIEIKWRDATTDGDHMLKEHARLKCIADAGYKPVRVMFYTPNRTQAQKIQKRLAAAYMAEGGEYHAGDDAWAWLKSYSGIDLLGVMKKMETEAAKV